MPTSGEKKGAQQQKTPAAKNVARQKSRVALRATSLAAAVVQNGHLDPNVAPAQHHVLFAKKGITGHFGAKNRHVLKPSTNHTPGPASHRTCFWLEMASTPGCLLCLANFEGIEAIH